MRHNREAGFTQQYAIMSCFKNLFWINLTSTFSSLPGNIRNTEKLSYDRQQQYEIQVTAWDCGQKRALHSVPVRIDVKPVCKPGWQGWSLLYLPVCVCVHRFQAGLTVRCLYTQKHRCGCLCVIIVCAVCVWLHSVDVHRCAYL